jgi:lipoprotein NlpI
LKDYLQNRKPGQPDDWPLQIGLFLSGQLTESNFLEAANGPDLPTSKGQHCEACFYIGSKRLVDGDKMGAVEFFKKCKSTGMTDFEEYQSAVRELFRLELPVPQRQ